VSTLVAHAATAAAVLAAGAWSAWTIHRLKVRLGRALWACAHDPLTGLPNRVYAAQLFTQRAGLPTVVAVLDLNRFKQVNDTHGHHAGDQLLATVAGRLAAATARYGGHAARLSGDEFLLLLPHHPDRDYPEPVGSILAEITTPVQVTIEHTIVLVPTATAGITWHDGLSSGWSSLLRQADIALYHARAHQLDYETWRPSMHMPNPAHRCGTRLRHQHPEATR
jgi:diguanylate cyclase (GGDEF)-like protein